MCALKRKSDAYLFMCRIIVYVYESTLQLQLSNSGLPKIRLFSLINSILNFTHGIPALAVLCRIPRLDLRHSSFSPLLLLLPRSSLQLLPLLSIPSNNLFVLLVLPSQLGICAAQVLQAMGLCSELSLEMGDLFCRVLVRHAWRLWVLSVGAGYWGRGKSRHGMRKGIGVA